MLEFVVVGSIFFIWFWLSLRPGSALGVAVTPSQMAQAFRELESKHLQTKANLRIAAQKATVIYATLFAVGVMAGVSGSHYSLGEALPGFLGGLSGIAIASVLLHWSTRPAGWYGVA